MTASHDVTPDPPMSSEEARVAASLSPEFVGRIDAELLSHAKRQREAAALIPSRGGVWKDLIRAAEFMKLNAVIPELQSQFEAAPQGPSAAEREQNDC